MATTIATLKKRFKAANLRVDKAIDRYRILASKLFMPYGGGIVNVADVIFHRNGSFEDATKLSWVFYRRGRGGKFYEKQQTEDKRHCDACDQPCYMACPHFQHADKVSQDYLDLRRLEYAIDAAVDTRGLILDELEAAGVNPYTEKDLW